MARHRWSCLKIQAGQGFAQNVYVVFEVCTQYTSRISQESEETVRGSLAGILF